MSEQGKLTLIQTVFKRIWVFVIGTVLVVALILAWPFLWNNGSVKYADINEHFKYGSIGGEQVNGIPYWVWKVLPVVFRDKLPGLGYTSFGFIQEPGKDLPIGFAQSKIGVERVGQNCATCHAGTPGIIHSRRENNLLISCPRKRSALVSESYPPIRATLITIVRIKDQFVAAL